MRRNIVSVFLPKQKAMKKIIALMVCSLILHSCKENINKDVTSAELPAELTTPQSIAKKYGIDQWDEVSRVAFTFNVSRGDRHFERSFIWDPKTSDVIYMSATDTISYNRNASLDSLQVLADKAFINDSYWLFSPFKLVWDEGVTFSEERNVIAPISSDTLNKLTILYEGDGGYTPGDAYDFYFSEDHMIREWAYRGGNTEKASTTTSWMQLESFNGIQLNTVHQDSTGNFKLYFTNISIN
jgi:hypothetical protein